MSVALGYIAVFIAGAVAAFWCASIDKSPRLHEHNWIFTADGKAALCCRCAKKIVYNPDGSQIMYRELPGK